MKTLNMKKIARGLSAERAGKISSQGGYFGALQLLESAPLRPTGKSLGDKKPCGHQGTVNLTDGKVLGGPRFEGDRELPRRHKRGPNSYRDPRMRQ